MMDKGDPVIEVRSLSARYGRRNVLNDVSFETSAGEIVALLGGNGAGKSTLIRRMIGTERITGGTAKLFGRDVWKDRAKLMHRVGYVAEDADGPPDVSVGMIHDFLRAMHRRWNGSIVVDSLERARISEKQSFGSLSKGQKKRLSLALALATEPDLLVLDDPTLGLDAVSRKELFEQVIGDLAARGTTVFLASHDLAGIESIANRILILRDGKIALDEEIETLKERFRRIRFRSPRAADAEAQVEPLLPIRRSQWGNAREIVVSNYRPEAEPSLREAEVTALSLEEIVILMSEEGSANA